MDKSCRMEGDWGWHGPHVSCGKEVLNCHIFTIGHVKFVKRAPASNTVFNWVWSFSSGRKPHRQLTASGITAF